MGWLLMAEETRTDERPRIRVDQEAAEAALRILYRPIPDVFASRARNVLRAVIEQSEQPVGVSDGT